MDLDIGHTFNENVSFINMDLGIFSSQRLIFCESNYLFFRETWTLLPTNRRYVFHSYYIRNTSLLFTSRNVLLMMDR